VSKAEQAIVDVTEESSAGASETAGAVKDLVDLSEQLIKAVSRSKIEGRRPGRPQEPPS
jgi:hypothetical protein